MCRLALIASEKGQALTSRRRPLVCAIGPATGTTTTRAPFTSPTSPRSESRYHGRPGVPPCRVLSVSVEQERPMTRWAPRPQGPRAAGSWTGAGGPRPDAPPGGRSSRSRLARTTTRSLERRRDRTQGEDDSERLCAEILVENRFEVIRRVPIASGNERPVDVHGRGGSGVPEPVGHGPHIDALGEQLGGDEVA